MQSNTEDPQFQYGRPAIILDFRVPCTIERFSSTGAQKYLSFFSAMSFPYFFFDLNLENIVWKDILKFRLYYSIVPKKYTLNTSTIIRIGIYLQKTSTWIFSVTRPYPPPSPRLVRICIRCSSYRNFRTPDLDAANFDTRIQYKPNRPTNWNV